MIVILAAMVAGTAFGLATGGRLRNLGRSHLRSLWLLVVGAGLQVVAPHVQSVVPFLVSYALLAAFAARNLTRLGMGVVVIGIGLNAAPIAANGGMPVEAHAIVSARVASASELGDLDLSGKRHLATTKDHLRALDDTIPDWFTHEVMSFGDLVIAVGVGAVMAGLLHPSYAPSVSHRS